MGMDQAVRDGRLAERLGIRRGGGPFWMLVPRGELELQLRRQGHPARFGLVEARLVGRSRRRWRVEARGMPDGLLGHPGRGHRRIEGAGGG